MSFFIQNSLNHTSKLLATAKEDLKQSQYNLKEKDFIISEQKKAGLWRLTISILWFKVYLLFFLIIQFSWTENALAHQACVLRADLEKSIRDNASLFSKIGKLVACYSWIFFVDIWEFCFLMDLLPQQEKTRWMLQIGPLSTIFRLISLKKSQFSVKQWLHPWKNRINTFSLLRAFVNLV